MKSANNQKQDDLFSDADILSVVTQTRLDEYDNLLHDYVVNEAADKEGSAFLELLETVYEREGISTEHHFSGNLETSPNGHVICHSGYIGLVFLPDEHVNLVKLAQELIKAYALYDSDYYQSKPTSDGIGCDEVMITTFFIRWRFTDDTDRVAKIKAVTSAIKAAYDEKQ